MNRQRGAIELAVLVIAGVVAAAAFLGLWAYYGTQLAELKADNTAKGKAIEKQAKELGTVNLRASVLQDANKDCGTKVNEANAKTDALRQERNEAWQGYNDAKAAAELKAKGFEAQIDKIRQVKESPGGDWCTPWGTEIERYVAGRQAK